MGLSCRIFLLDEDDGLYRLPTTTYERMLRDPRSYPLPRFAGARVRTVEAIVRLLDRQVTDVVRTTFGILTFDRQGCFDLDAFGRHQRARAELAFAHLGGRSKAPATVIDAASRFVAQGGRWAPSRTLALQIERAALGRLKCARL